MKKQFYKFATMLFLLVATVSVNQVQAQSYCKPTFSAGGCNGYDVSSIGVGNFSASPSCTSTGYDSSGLSGAGITVYRGKTYAVSVAGGSNGESFGVYIDYQNDGSFEDIGDYVADDVNGSYTSITQNVTIPLASSPVVTRMRFLAVSGTAVNYNTDCKSYSSGSCVDYKLTITAYPKDIAIRAISPAYCPNKKEPVQVIIRNIGLNSLNSIPFTFKVGSTTVNGTYSRLLASNTEDTFTVGTFDASTAGTYNVSVYANLTGDGDRSNDTINASLHIAQPASPTVTATINHCGPGAVWMNGKSTTAKTFTDWFTTDTGQVPFAKNIDSVRTPNLAIGQSLTYYAESRFNTNDTLTKGNFSIARENYGGTMCDIFAKNLVIIDSLDVNFNETGSDSCAVWLKIGTHNGFQNDKSAWTHIATVPVTAGGSSSPTHVRLPYPITLQVGTLYGLYTYATSFNDVNAYDLTYLSSNPQSNADLSITAGNSMGAGGPFNGAVTNGRDWDGRIYYHLNACPSPRVSTTVTMLQNPNGATLAKGVPFQGKYNAGDEVHSDNVCVGDSIRYIITPPTGMKESDYGTKWTVNSMYVNTVRGFASKDTVSRMPTTTAAGYIEYIPKFGDSVFVVSVDMKTAGTGCDSVLQRYITASANPIVDFSFVNPCGNLPVLLKSLATVPSSFDTVKTWAWDYGDGTGTSTRQVPYPYKYAKPGSYTVSLTATSNAGCPTTGTKTLTEYPVPVAEFGSKPLCNDRPVTLLDSSTVGSPDNIAKWNWTLGDGNTSTTQSPVHTYAKSGPYNVQLVVTTNNGCVDTLTKTVRVEPIPVPKFSFSDKCVGVPIYMSTSGTIDSSVKLPTFLWNYGDKSASTTVGNHTYAANGTYTIKLVATTEFGCADSITHPITPNAVTVPKITYTAECVGQTVPFVDSSGAANSTYSWTYGDGGSSLDTSSGNVFHNYKDTGTYTVWLKIQNGANCVDSNSRTVYVPGYPTASFTAPNVCVGNTTVFKNTSSTNNTRLFTWDFGDGSARSNIPDPTYTYAAAGTYSVKLIATSPFGCADSTSSSINVNPLPVIKAWTYGKANDHYTVNITPADPSIGTFEWYFDATDSSSSKTPTFTYPNNGPGTGAKYQIKLIVTNSFGCKSSRTDSVFTGIYNGIEVTGTTFDGITVYPNPFEGSTNISYTLPEASNVNIKVYTIEGKLVATLKDGKYAAGNYITSFDARKYNVAEGVYYLKMSINNQNYTTKIISTK